jgi:hypothetical protein
MAFSSESGGLTGVFDFGGACLGDRHLDFRYLAAWQSAFLIDAGRAYSERATVPLSARRCLAINVANDLTDVVDYTESGRVVRGGGSERRIRRLTGLVARWPREAW